MKNFVQDGDNITVTVADNTDAVNLSSGDGYLIGTLFGVAEHDADIGASVTISTEGVFSLAKVAAQAWAVGDAIYWDDAAKNCTTTSNGNTLVGKAVAVAANPSSTGVVRLNG